MAALLQSKQLLQYLDGVDADTSDEAASAVAGRHGSGRASTKQPVVGTIASDGATATFPVRAESHVQGKPASSNAARRQFIWDEFDHTERESKGDIPTYFSVDTPNLPVAPSTITSADAPSAQPRQFNVRQLVLELQVMIFPQLELFHSGKYAQLKLLLSSLDIRKYDCDFAVAFRTKFTLCKTSYVKRTSR